MTHGLRRLHRLRVAGLAVGAALLFAATPGYAWGPEGHEVVALIAQARLAPAVRARVERMLSADPDALTAHDIAAEATWADVYRDSSDARYHATSKWHYVDLELRRPSLSWACYRFPHLAPDQPASQGPPDDCAVHKIEQFERELQAPATPPSERLLALKFLLHLVGDLHQPLHAADDHDRGGNDERVVLPGHAARSLHAYWDSVFVAELDPDAARLAVRLNASITPAEVARWQQGSPAAWAWESWRIAKRDAYDRLPTPDANGRYHLDAGYDENARRVVARQLQKAGVRLAWLLDRTLHR